MKRFLAIAISVIFMALALASCGKDTDVPKGMKLCEENDYYIMFVPEDGWEVIETGSDFGLAQATRKTIVGTSGDLSNVTVNSVYFRIDDDGVEGETNEERNNRLFDSYFNRLKSQLTGEFDQIGDGAGDGQTGLFTEFASGEPRDFTLGDDAAREYIYTAKYGDLYYKYYTTVIIHGDNYYVITFNFPQNVTRKDGEIVKDTSVDDVIFNDGSYTADMENIVENFIAKN